MRKLPVVLRKAVGLALVVALGVSSSVALAANRDKSPLTTKPKGEIVEMFKAIDAGDIEVRLIFKDATEANVLFKNKTDKPLAIKLPEAFAGVPVLAQFCGGGMGMGLMGMCGGGGGNQGAGGGFGGGMMGGMGGMGGGGFFDVGPDKIRKIKVKTVCLEHGKLDPNPRIKYKIVPIESFTKKADVIEVCKMLGHGELSQNMAQAAAWHLANGLSWQELAAKDRIRSKRRNFAIKYFSPQELTIAYQAVKEASRRAKSTPVKTPSKGNSLSNE